ncbi:hypothetical protein J3A83DRAFT_3491608 [Scleroderma citrinum]
MIVDPPLSTIISLAMPLVVSLTHHYDDLEYWKYYMMPIALGKRGGHLLISRSSADDFSTLSIEIGCTRTYVGVLALGLVSWTRAENDMCMYHGTLTGYTLSENGISKWI